jgi:hypothetical protein
MAVFSKVVVANPRKEILINLEHIVLIEPAALDPAEEGSVVTLVTGEKITLALSEENIFRGLKYSISSGPRATATSAT